MDNNLLAKATTIDEAWKFLSPPQPQSRIIMNNDPSIEWHLVKPKPNRWRRMWYWLLLGWKWEDINDDS